VVLVDHTKVGIETMSQTVAPEHISCVITDDQADPVEVDRLRQAGIEVVVTTPKLNGDLDGSPSYGEIHRALALPRTESKKR
jgi:hypothetical protein